MRNNSLYQKLEKKYIILVILLFVGILPAMLFLYTGFYPLNIYLKSDEYKKGEFYLEKVDCGSGYGADNSVCVGYGTINNEKASVDLGLSPSVSSIYKNPNYADLSSDTIAVFFRSDLKQTIVREKNEDKLDRNKYLKKGVINLIYPLAIYPFIVLYHRKVKKQLKQLENEQKIS
ncbi:hypothetical protein [Tenacibaculum maritimum]|uniref:hypothetical protein n=2 Tax=Tenacibaculum maritimum TaxID=107401 RepID=UPI0010A4783C|nr:hypothetical protein [Tenacibaculum maritimum]MCD9583253.1 hypothetical protein [Tenacibaculum maritimum]MCD9637262.1 hypothetical protein [Tenacibaculum maritimum]QCD61709.1 hypothetical protein B9C57_03730 [Tenacibaculum maritimum]CAA0164942.1 hypothetical protein FS0810_120013 [Tenacibaculum maritimum]CAA0170957.1 hypothetical protein AQ1689_330004 [Tenacibaculum maritimum]